MSDYNLFNKKLSDIEFFDLERLVSEKVSEGWYLEYKCDFQDKKRIAKSISSFANSEGGWYIIGIEEESCTNVAKEIAGFKLDKKHSNVKETIANIIKSNIMPIPFFESKLIKFKDGKRGVLVVKVEKGMDTPYIVDGSIYERIGEISHPIPLKDKYRYNKLLDRRKELEKDFEYFCNNNFKINRKQNGFPYLELYIYIPQKNFKFENFHESNFLKKLLNNFNSDISLFYDSRGNSDEYSFKGLISWDDFLPSIDLLSWDDLLPLDNFSWKNVLPQDDDLIPPKFGANMSFLSIHSSFNSYILRGTETSVDSTEIGLTIEIFKNGNFKLIFPMSILSKNINEVIKEYNYDYFQNFLNVLSDNELNSIKIIDINSLFLVAMIILNQYLRFLNSYSYNEKFWMRSKIFNIFQTVPFINSEDYLEFIEDYSLPICIKSKVEIPDFVNNYKLKYSINEFNSFIFTTIILESLGFPYAKSEYLAKSLGSYVSFLSSNKIKMQ